MSRPNHTHWTAIGRFIDNLGVSLQGKYAQVNKISKHRRLIPFKDGQVKVEPTMTTLNNFIAPSASVVGNVTVGDRSSVWYNSVIRGDDNQILIGDNSSIGENCVLHSSAEQRARQNASPIIIGNNVVIESGVLMQGCTVQNHANIQMGSIILDGAIIGSCSIVAAGTVVPADFRIPPKQLWGGSPAQFIRDLTEEEVDNLKQLSEEKKALASKHENEHLKSAYEMMDDYESREFHYVPEDKGRY